MRARPSLSVLACLLAATRAWEWRVASAQPFTASAEACVDEVTPRSRPSPSVPLSRRVVTHALPLTRACSRFSPTLRRL